jgi:hypothetical protein
MSGFSQIERLEEERLELKRKLRKQALHRGQRAVELGLTVEDLAVAELGDEGDRGEQYVTKTRSEPGRFCYFVLSCICRFIPESRGNKRENYKVKIP